MNLRRLMAAALFCVALVGCSSSPAASSPAAAPAAPVTVTATVSAAEPYDSLAAINGMFDTPTYLKLVRDNIGSMAGRSDHEVLLISQQVCGIFNPSQGGDAQLQWAMVVKAMTALKLTPREAGAMVTFATRQYCGTEANYIPTG